jgi:hypothetical protein
MQVLVDGNKLTLNSSMVNLEEILTEISNTQENQERTIWNVTLNGKRYAESYPHEAQKTKREDIKTLEVSTQNQQEICGSFLVNSALILQRLINSGEKIAGLFRTGDPKEANKHFLNFLESYQYLMCLLNESIKLFKINPDKIFIPLRKGHPSSFDKMLDDMTRAQKNEDWVMLADELEIKLVPLLKQWMQVLPLLTKSDALLSEDALSS